MAIRDAFDLMKQLFSRKQVLAIARLIEDQ